MSPKKNPNLKSHLDLCRKHGCFPFGDTS